MTYDVAMGDTAAPRGPRRGAVMRRVWAAGAGGAVLLAVTALFLVAGGATGTRPASPASPQALLDELVRAGVPGAVALVRRDGRVRTFTAGVADLQTRRPMRGDLRFRVGSISKTVVASLILRLVAQGRLHLSDTVGHWLGGLLPAAEGVTVEQLLAQRSGVPDYLELPPVDSDIVDGHTPLGKVWTARQLLALVSGRPLAFAPGTQFAYSSTNYIVLGQILERVTGMPLERYAQRTLFGPLHMRSTSFALGRVPGAHAHGYVPFPGAFASAPGHLGDVEVLNGSSYGAAASLVSTAADLDRFFRALFGARIIPRRLVALMQATRPGAGADFQGYGLGLEATRNPCGRSLGHGGVVFGYRAVVRASADAHTLIVLLVDHDYSPPPLAAAMDATASALYCGR